MPRAEFAPIHPALPATERQVLKLLVMLKNSGVINPGRRDDDLYNYEFEAVEWINCHGLGFEIDRLSDLTHTQIGRLYKVIEQE